MFQCFHVLFHDRFLSVYHLCVPQLVPQLISEQSDNKKCYRKLDYTGNFTHVDRQSWERILRELHSCGAKATTNVLAKEFRDGALGSIPTANAVPSPL